MKLREIIIVVLIGCVGVIVRAQKPLPTLFIVGDSTVKNSSEGLPGWGDLIADFFDLTRLRVENRARGVAAVARFKPKVFGISFSPRSSPGTLY